MAGWEAHLRLFRYILNLGGKLVRIAYFVNQYPAVSHTFIRREINAIESLGATVFRYAARAGETVDPIDVKEEEQAHYILRVGAGELLRCCVLTLLSTPLQSGRVLLQALNMGLGSERGILRPLAYAAEAAVLARWCRRDAIEHIHAHFGTNPAAIAMFASELCGVPYSFTAHGSEEFEKAVILSLDTKLSHAAFVASVSYFGRGQLMRWTPPKLWHKIKIIRCGLDGSFFTSSNQSKLPDVPRLVCVGRLDEHKAQIVLVAAARRLRDAGIQFHIVLVGDGEMRPHVEEAIRRNGLEREISITGWVPSDRVKAEMEAARALVLPSVSENLPVVIMEAFALGRPIISTFVAGIPELVEPGKSGWLVPASDEIALASAMREALEAPVEQLERMAASGRLRVIEYHDVMKEAAKLKDLFEVSISGNPLEERSGQYFCDR